MPYMQHLTGMNVIVFSMVFSITKTFIYFLSKKGPKLLLLLYLNVPLFLFYVPLSQPPTKSLKIFPLKGFVIVIFRNYSLTMNVTKCS